MNGIPVSYSIVIPVLNQLQYTRQCVESLSKGGVPPSALFIINNGSTDGTAGWLDQRADIPHISNPVNLGCGCAWTQGAILRHSSDWVIIFNNDVIAPPGFADALIEAGKRFGLEVVSPALLEGPLDYDFAGFARSMTGLLSNTLRRGWVHGVCFAVKREVFQRIGFFDTDRRLGGHEDKEFFVRCDQAGIPVGTTGAAVLHHFGSITQKALKLELGIKKLGDHRFAYRRMGMTWFDRKRYKRRQRLQKEFWVREEFSKYQVTMHMERENSQWIYR